MKSIEQPPLYFSKKMAEDSAAAQPQQSPYLKAILSGNMMRTTKIVRMTISDRLAAIRYIRESKGRHSLFRG